MLLLFQRSYAANLTKGWNEFVSEGIQLKEAGSYSEALLAFREALTIAEAQQLSGLSLLEIRDHLASTYAETEQYNEAAHQYREALRLLEKLESTNSLDYAIVLGKMTLLPGQGAASGQAIAILRQAVLVYRSKGPARKVFMVQSNLAQLLLKHNHNGEAEQVLLQLRSDLLISNQESETMAECLTELGVLQFNQSHFAEAAEFYLGSLNAHELADGNEHPHLIRPLNNLATAYAKSGRFSDASPLYQRALSICAKALGEDQSLYGVLLQNYGDVLRKLGRKHEGQLMRSKGMLIQRTSLKRSGAGSTIDIRALR